jgi:microcystin-dependent protein
MPLTEPTTLPELATTDGANMAEPVLALKEDGYDDEAIPTAKNWNWFGHWLSRWCAYLKEKTADLLSRMGTAEGDISDLDDQINTVVTGIEPRLVVAEGQISGIFITLNTPVIGIDARLTTAEGEIDTLQAITPVPVGAILPFYGTTAPTNYLVCDGSAFSGVTYPALAVVLGGTTLPSLKGKFLVGYDSTDSDYNAMGDTGGSKTHTLGETEIPAHEHNVRFSTNNFYTGTNTLSGMKAEITTTGADLAVLTAEDQAGTVGQAHENRPPFYTVNYIIKAK